MLHLKSSRHKAFIFVLELGIAFILFLGFISTAYLEPEYVQNSILATREKEVLSNTLAILDRNGYIFEVTDSNDYTPEEKMDLIYEKIKSMLPNNYEARISLDVYQADVENCKSNKTFENCFDKLDTYSPSGENIPINESVLFEKVFLPKKELPLQCTVGANFFCTLIYF